MRIIFFCILACFCTAGVAQSLSIGEELLFAFEVKQIDEFIERFNNEETLIKEYIRRADPGAVISRTDMLKSLINQYDSTWNLSLINQFIYHVNDREKPVYLHFLDPEWYAEVKCSVRYMNKDQKVTLLLKIERGLDQSSKWVILLATADFLTLPQNSDNASFLNPVSQGTDFLALDKAMADKKNLRNFLPAGYKEDQLSIFLDHWKNGRIALRQVDKITYHFLQVNGWIFTVENFKRQSRNGGWLISAICKADEVQKNEYKTGVLHLN
jgi:hypothetical protein